MAILVVGMCVHLWLRGRSAGPADPALSRDRYRATLEREFDKQIRMLTLARYWFLVPLAVTGAATAWAYLYGAPAEKDWFYFPLICVGTAFAWWANNRGAKTIRRDWEKIRRALDDGEMA